MSTKTPSHTCQSSWGEVPLTEVAEGVGALLEELEDKRKTF